MRALSGKVEPEQVADAIIHHSSVRSMLLTQKAIAEGGRSMLYECAQIADRMLLCEANGDEKGAQVPPRPPRVLDDRPRSYLLLLGSLLHLPI